MAKPDIRVEPSLFRVHFADGAKLKVTALSAIEAAALAKKCHAGKVLKIKLVREDA